MRDNHVLCLRGCGFALHPGRGDFGKLVEEFSQPWLRGCWEREYGDVQSGREICRSCEFRFPVDQSFVADVHQDVVVVQEVASYDGSIDVGDGEVPWECSAQSKGSIEVDGAISCDFRVVGGVENLFRWLWSRFRFRDR